MWRTFLQWLRETTEESAGSKIAAGVQDGSVAAKLHWDASAEPAYRVTIEITEGLIKGILELTNVSEPHQDGTETLLAPTIKDDTSNTLLLRGLQGMRENAAEWKMYHYNSSEDADEDHHFRLEFSPPSSTAVYLSMECATFRGGPQTLEMEVSETLVAAAPSVP